VLRDLGAQLGGTLVDLRRRCHEIESYSGARQSPAVLLALRVGWFVVPVVAGPAVAHGLAHTSTPVAVVAQVLAWGVRGGVVVAVLVPRTVSLTAIRIAAPAALAAVGWAAIRAGVGPAELAALAVTALVTAAVLFVPQVADAFVDGSSYGPERRMILRTPAALLLGPVELAWIVVVAGACAGPLLLAARSWIAGAVALAAGAVLVRPAARALHRLSRRWVVFVPAGLVLHDHALLSEPILFQKRDVRSIGPATSDVDGAADVTGKALGLALELRLTERSSLGLVTSTRGASTTVETDRVLFTPARPGALLREARQRGLATVPPPSTSSPS
jgi:hypothetical protein